MKSIYWVGSARKDMRRLPEAVRYTFGYALYLARRNEKHAAAKPLKGFGGAGVLDIVEDFAGDTYRAAYTVRFQGAVYVLHVLQKKSKQGAATPQADMNLIRERLKLAEAHYHTEHSQP
ncbi:MAG TPA: type II toxin-antitoxin system RelE/ParE family toxin [Candidatus Hydrogenedentes bacterium]|nr:type II toxin-antitoxin system RelE/ParE family toxin [Candidatus Hydrogenedentota bacterium]HNT87700.1 type II toxin-antitoxin system RelE/ParE family toxin [Candidatus Hydrogenedentota bacterium]